MTRGEFFGCQRAPGMTRCFVGGQDAVIAPSIGTEPRKIYYAVIRSQMPAGWTLITFLAGDTREGWLAQLGEADFLIVADWAITQKELQAAPKLRMIQHQGVGHEKIDKAALKAAGDPPGPVPAGTHRGAWRSTRSS